MHEDVRSVLVMVLSAVIFMPLVLFVRCKHDPPFKFWQAVDIVMNSVDVGSDVLFIVEAYEKGANQLALVSSVCLVAVSTLSFVCTTIGDPFKKHGVAFL